MMEKSFEIFGLKDYIDEALSIDNVKRAKPSPEGINKILRSFGLKPSYTFFVGDSVTDMKAARNAKVLGIGVLSGIGTKKDLTNAGAELVIRSVSSLPRILKN